MVNANMRIYDYFTYGEQDAYGQPKLSEDVQGTVKMAIHIASQGIKDSATYTGTEYIGLTHADVDSKYVIQYGDEKLKVLYVNPTGTWKQVYLTRM